MANKKITELNPIVTVHTTDVLAIVDLTASETKKVTVAQLIAMLSLGTVVGDEVVSGSNTSWALANTPRANTLNLFAMGQRLKLAEDYSISGANITTMTAFPLGSVVANYTHD